MEIKKEDTLWMRLGGRKRRKKEIGNVEFEMPLDPTDYVYQADG